MGRAAELKNDILLPWFSSYAKNNSTNQPKIFLKFSCNGYRKHFLSFLLLMIILFCQVAKSATECFVFETLQERKQFELLLKELRCVTCPNQNIADSHAPVAAAMRQEIYRRIKQGESQECIRTYLFTQYGEYVSYRPIIKVQNFPLWVMPFLMLTLGIFVWIKKFSQK